MSGGTRFQLKQPTGWFAAGREVRCALELLSDATFKLFVWLCLHAERGRGALSATPAELARALGRKESDMHLALEELERQGVCTLRADRVIEIRDRFWPYQREYDSAASDESRRYVEEVKRRFLQRRCVQSSFTAADEKLALALHHRGSRYSTSSVPFCWAPCASTTRSARTEAARRSAACTTSPTSSKKSNKRYRLSTGPMSPTR